MSDMPGDVPPGDAPPDDAPPDDTRTLAIRPAEAPVVADGIDKIDPVDPIDPTDLPAIWKALARAAIDGEVRAAEVARRWVRMHHGRIRLNLAPIDDASGVARAQAQLLALVAAGAITPREGRDVSVMVENRRRAIETLEFEPQLHALNEANRERERQHAGPP